MQEKLSQYDLLARLVPGGALLWTVNWVLISSKIGSIPIGQGGITEAIAFALIAYVVGLILDSLGRWTVEPVLYRIFGKPSRTFLVDDNRISELDRQHFRTLATTRVGSDIEFSFEGTKGNEASDFLCRRVIGLFGTADDKVRSMFVQYTLHRSLTAAMLIVMLSSSYSCIFGMAPFWILGIELALLAILFLGANHWGFRIVRTTFDQLDRDALGLKSSEKYKDE